MSIHPWNINNFMMRLLSLLDVTYIRSVRVNSAETLEMTAFAVVFHFLEIKKRYVSWSFVLHPADYLTRSIIINLYLDETRNEKSEILYCNLKEGCGLLQAFEGRNFFQSVQFFYMLTNRSEETAFLIILGIILFYICACVVENERSDAVWKSFMDSAWPHRKDESPCQFGNFTEIIDLLVGCERNGEKRCSLSNCWRSLRKTGFSVLPDWQRLASALLIKSPWFEKRKQVGEKNMYIMDKNGCLLAFCSSIMESKKWSNAKDWMSWSRKDKHWSNR